MISLPFYFRQSLFGYFCRRWQTRRFEKHTLPGAEMAEVEGVKLEIADLNLEMKRVVLEGRYEAAELAICRDLISPGERILDIGAGIGCVGLFCLKRMKAASVISVEANPATAERLRRNYEINGFKAACIGAALAAEDGTAALHTNSDFWCDSLNPDRAGADRRTLTMRALTFSSILREVGTEFSTLLADVEGAEEFLAWECLPACTSKVLLEIHPEVLGAPRAFDVVYRLMLQGFEVTHAKGQVFGLVRKDIRS